MSDQLDLLAAAEPPRPPIGRVRVEALAGTMVGFVLPGYGSGAKVPAKVMAVAVEVAGEALAALEARVRKT